MDDKPIDALGEAKQRLAKAALAQHMTPTSAGISAYVTCIITAARVDALQDLWVNAPNETWSREEALEAALIRSITATAEKLEQLSKDANRVQIASADTVIRTN